MVKNLKIVKTAKHVDNVPTVKKSIKNVTTEKIENVKTVKF